VRGFIIEGGIYFLLLFTPLAFGGVESWALGVIQGITGLVFIAWAWGSGGSAGRNSPHSPIDSGRDKRRLRLVWIAIALFVILVCLQLTPLPPAVIQEISPRTYDLYSNTLPGFAEGNSAGPQALTTWILEKLAPRIPFAADPKRESQVLHPPVEAATPAAGWTRWRTLSIYPFQTRQRLTLLLCLIALFASVTGHFVTRERMSRLLGVVVFSGLAVSLLGILQKFNWNGRLYWIREGDYVAPFGPFVDRNTYAAFAGTILPIAICLTFSALRQLSERRRDALPLLLFHGFASVTLAGGIFYSLSRGGMISTCLSLAIIAGLLVYYGRSRSELAALAGILVAAASFLLWIGPEKVIERVGTLSQGQSTPSLALRTEAWRHSIGLIADHLVVGTGFGTFAYSFMRYAPPGRSWWNIAHNEYIELICDTGLAGASVFLAGLAAWLLLIWRPGIFRGHRGRYEYSGIVAGVAALLLHSGVTSNLQIPANSLLLVVLGGALIGVVLRRESKNNSALPDEGSLPGHRRNRAS